MKIAIDAKWYFDGPPSGRVVVKNLVDHILQLHCLHEIILILDQKCRDRTLESTNKRVTCIYVWAGNNLLSNLFIVPFVLVRHKVDVFIGQNFVSPFGSVKQLAYIHDIIFISHPQYYTWIERLYFSPLRFLTGFAAGVVTVSHSEKRRLVEYGFSDPEQIWVVHHGCSDVFVPKEQMDPLFLQRTRMDLGLPEGYLLFVGRLNARKNLLNLLRALVRMSHNNVPLVIVGDYDWKHEKLDSLTMELGLKKRLLFTGSLHGQTLAAVYAMATVFCFPSFEESFGLPPLEAMACGVPVVVSKTSSLPEICGEAGIYVDPGDPSDVAVKLDALMSNKRAYEARKKQSLDRARTFSWNESAAKLIKIAEGVV